MDILEKLLDRYWIHKESDPETYYYVKDNLHKVKPFIVENLGYQVIVKPNFIKLEKLPGKAEKWMGVQEFTTTMHYGLFCILLMYLESKGKGEQFILSQLTDYIKANYIDSETLNWTVFSHRKALITILKFAVKMELVKLDDGKEEDFLESSENEILYESTGLSRYFVRSFPVNILSFYNYKDFENTEWDEADSDVGIVRRHRVYRRLVMSPVVYKEEHDDVDYLYIRQYRSSLENNIENYLGLNLHIHKNGALIAVDESKSYKDVFPRKQSTESIMALNFNNLIRELVQKDEITLNADDTITLTFVQFQALVRKMKERFQGGWSKTYREASLEKTRDILISYMEGFNMLKYNKEENIITILPLSGKVIGTYPEDFLQKLQEEYNGEQ